MLPDASSHVAVSKERGKVSKRKPFEGPAMRYLKFGASIALPSHAAMPGVRSYVTCTFDFMTPDPHDLVSKFLVCFEKCSMYLLGSSEQPE